MSYATPPCPTDPAHGRLLDLTSERFSWFCPHRAHEVAGTTAFFDSDLAPVSRREPTRPPTSAHSPRRERGSRMRSGVK